ncbi:MAG TPA: nucleoside triphosphate pyrophosphohydrolase [Methylotenera sp.]|nr:nucleoside triphosphate pyrophosphohydrolase [Methylotenera sp.]HPN01045.1 nucleoside triphosphate pyrophosphohydrolase [Methylotenera sp.]
MINSQAITPINPVHLLTSEKLIKLPIGSIFVDQIGQKAFGLSCIPHEWTPSFCVISHSAAIEISSKPEILQHLKQLDWFKSLQPTDHVMIRSSAINETIGERGQLISEQTTVNDLQKTLTKCLRETEDSDSTIHWILQPKIVQLSMGHLSNERRISKHKRDWLLEFEMIKEVSKIRTPVPICIRQWREGVFKAPEPMECASSIAIDSVLRNPAQWATERMFRIHYEWVWDGRFAWIVQADFCTEITGIDPKSFLPRSIHKNKSINLRHFRLINESDFKQYRKLANSKLYSELGYSQPVFYVLDDTKIIDDLLSGKANSSVLAEIETLLKQQALVIRTDVIKTEGVLRHMLPRSDGLGTLDAVITWFSNELPEKLKLIENWNDNLIFICHHYIPALASAWSWAEPRKRVVRVEALWGIPEGMYWYSHDAYEVDTTDSDLSKATLNSSKFRHFERLRFKEWYVAPDPSGIWSHQRASEPYDWNSTIKDKNWLSEMAITTRKIAEQLGHAVNVMWFLGVHKDASNHNILPWFHHKSEFDTSSLRVAPRFKDPNSKSIEIHKLSDWETLRQSTKQDQLTIKRISVSPREPNLIRNDLFVEQLADFAKQQGAVVELMGGVLSHVFYMLQKKGCIVEIIDPFGTSDESLVFKKLVRDKVPESIEQKGELVTHIKVGGDQLVKALKAKLLEESIEVMDAQSTSDTLEELADVLEVVHAISKHLNISMKSIEENRKQKRNKRGGFDEGIVLVKTTAPASLSAGLPVDVQIESLFPDGVIVESGAISLEQDIKLHQDDPETHGIKQRLLEIEFPTAPDGQIKRTTEFRIMANLEKGIIEIPFKGEWIISRKKAELKVRLLITPTPIQIKLPFE